MMRGRCPLVAALALCLLGAGSPGQSPMEGWSVSAGDWTGEKNTVQCGGNFVGRLKWDGEAKKCVEIQFALKVNKWIAEPKYVGILWAATGDGSFKGERNVAVVRSNGKLEVYAHNRQSGRKKKLDCQIRLGKPVKFRAKITPKGITIAVGRTKLMNDMPVKELGQIMLFVHGADVEFGKVKIKGK